MAEPDILLVMVAVVAINRIIESTVLKFVDSSVFGRARVVALWVQCISKIHRDLPIGRRFGIWSMICIYIIIFCNCKVVWQSTTKTRRSDLDVIY